MALIDRIPAADAAHRCARALEQLLGHDVVITVADPVVTQPTPQVVPEQGTRSVALPFGAGLVGEVTLVLDEQFAMSLEAAAPDASLVTAALPALEAAADAIATAAPARPASEDAGEISTTTLLTSVLGSFVIVPLLEGEDVVALMVVRVLDEEPAAIAPPEPAPQPVAHAEPDVAPLVAVPVPTAPAPLGSGGAARHVFQPLTDTGGGTGPTRPLALLNDVKLKIVAELGRRQMKVRELVSLQPGSVIELDRAAGSPVDVMVNGILLAHGEVVVIDEEFGIRLSEIIPEDA